MDVLSPVRTYWEKATLIHDACISQKITNSAARISRHWYDLYKLAQMAIGEQALLDTGSLISVINHKKAFYPTEHMDYDACASGHIHLVPGEEGLRNLERDYQNMADARMIDDPPGFQEIMGFLVMLQEKINLGFAR